MQKKYKLKNWFGFIDALADSILESSDEDIYNEVKELGENPKENAEKVRNLISQAIMLEKKRKLIEARKMYEAKEKNSTIKQLPIPFNLKDKIELIIKALTNVPQSNKASVMMQFRELKKIDDIDDNDADIIIHKLIQLGLLKDEDIKNE